MIGRADERAAIGRLLADSRAGRSGALVLSGAPGVGKSALLAHAIDLAEGMRVLQAGGVETEIDVAFAGLDQLLRPVLALAERLPPRQADALLGALRRLEAEGIVLLAATREGGWPGLPELQVVGLDPDEAAQLLRETAGEIAPDVCVRLVEETDGNPLALIELVGALSAEQVAGTEPLSPQAGAHPENPGGILSQGPPPAAGEPDAAAGRRRRRHL
jgi:AAA ATPase domain